MNKFKRKSLYLALAAGIGAVGVAGSASAVNIAPNGLGQVLIYPYYTVRGGTDTALSVVNTTASGKAVKVRFTEGKNSREVLDFNLYLSPHDAWSGMVTATADGAKIITNDNSCTAPAITKGSTNGQAFVNYAYAGAVLEGIVDSGGDGESATLDRTREGYFEIIEMGTITNPAILAAITHNSAGTPANCSLVSGSIDMSVATGGANAVGVLTGGLSGAATLINVAAGTDYSYEPVVLASFRNAASLGAWYAPGSIRPDMRDARPVTSIVFKTGSTVTTDWAASSTRSTDYDSVNAVSALLMHHHLINEYVLDTITASGTDWVITMPTKRYYVPVDSTPLAQTIYAPFTTSFYTGGACEPMTLAQYNREEQTVSTPGGFSPPAPGPAGTSLCWESTVMTFKNSNNLNSSNSVNFDVSYENGWANITFTQSYASLLAAPLSVPAGVHTYVGLPTVGFMFADYVNGNVGGVLANYAGSVKHNYTSNINGVSD